MTFRVPEVRRYQGVEFLRLHHLGQACRLGPVQTSCVGGDQQVGRGVAALALQPLQQGIRLAGDQVDLDAGLLGETIEQGLDQLLLARGVEIDLAGGGRQDRQDQTSQQYQVDKLAVD